MNRKHYYVIVFLNVFMILSSCGSSEEKLKKYANSNPKSASFTELKEIKATPEIENVENSVVAEDQHVNEAESPLSNDILGKWSDECILDSYRNLYIKNVGNNPTFQINWGDISTKNSISATKITSKQDGSYDCDFEINGKVFSMNIKNLSEKVLKVIINPSLNENKSTILVQCQKIKDEDEFNTLMNRDAK